LDFIASDQEDAGAMVGQLQLPIRMLRSCLVTAAFALAPIQAASGNDIPIAIAGPTTGGDGSLGRQMRAGAEQAVADINAAGGVLGRKLELRILDDACDPKQARSVAEKIAGMKVPFVAGHFCSAASITASEVYAEAGVLQISPASSSPTFTERRLWNTFRICGRDDQQGGFIASYIIERYRGKNIAILHDKSTYGKGLADATRAALKAMGAREKLYESYNKGEKDFTAIIAKLRHNSIDLVIVGGYHQEAGLILRQMRDRQIETVLVGGDALADKEFASITGASGEGALFTFGPDPRKNPAAAQVVKRLADNGIDPSGYTLYTYAAIQLWAKAAAEAGTIDAKKLAAMLKSRPWQTAIGTIAFDKKGDLTRIDWSVYKWDGKGQYFEIFASSS
jgi:branched-chain amino acid transport system substrate-binding protein